MATILITGANRGIGLELVRQCSQRGDQVIATCRNPEGAEDLKALAEKSDIGAIVIESLDVSDADGLARLSRSLVDRAQKLDIVFCNAGILVEQPFGQWDPKVFEETLSVNAIAPAMIGQSLGPLLASSAKWINVSSWLGSLGDPLAPGGPYLSYSMSKAALNMVTVNLAALWSSKDISVVSISPGWVRTDMGGAGANLSVEEAVRKLLSCSDGLTLKQSGCFLTNSGEPIAW